MRVFVTGATGFIGSAVVPNLLAAGHEVVGLARNVASAAALAAIGVAAHRGDLNDPEDLAAVARASDGVIHLAFIHDFANFAVSVATDLRVVQALAAALEGTGKPLVTASGTLMVSHARPATELVGPLSADMPRAASEMAVVEAKGVRGVVVRLPPPVHDLTRAGLLSGIAQTARERGFAAYLGDGAHVWPSVHRLDAARLFHLALEKGAAGTRLHAVAEEGVPMRDIMTVIGARLGVPVRGIGDAEAADYFGPLGMFAGRDNLSSSALTREATGWVPREVGLLDDLRAATFLD